MTEDIEFVKQKQRKHNRRSSFFQRSTVSCYSDSPTSSSSTSESQSTDTRPLRDATTEYLNKLKKEKQEWKELVNTKKKELEELKEKRPQAAPSVEFLTAEDRKFLDDKPDYLAIGRLLDNVTEVVAIKERRINSSIEKVNNFLTSCENISSVHAGDVIEYFLEDFGEFS